MAFVPSAIEIWTSELVNRFEQLPSVTVIAPLLTSALFLHRNRSFHRTWGIGPVILLLAFPAVPAAQESSRFASAVPATFELAAIKPSKPGAQGNTFRVSGHRFETVNTSLSDLISFAYGLHAMQVTGAPAWVQIDKYDLTAQSDAEGQSSEILWRGMLQKYLVQCFKLRFHLETQELPLYALTSGRTAPKLTESRGNPNGIPALLVTLGARNPANANLAAVVATNASMGDLANVMRRVVLDWPVVDQSGIVGRYNFVLKWTPDDSQFRQIPAKIPPPTDGANAPPDLFTALQEQIGLMLDVIYAPSEIMVIDRVERPSSN